MKIMKTARFGLLLILAVLVASCTGKRYQATASGKVTCKMADGSIEPLKRVVVKLMDHDFLIHSKFGETRSGNDGSFTISGSAKDLIGKPDPFIQIVYDYQGIYGHMEVDGFAGITRKYRTPKKKYAPSLSFGNIQVSDDHCRAYVQFYYALRDFYRRTGSKVPYKTLHVHTHVLIHGGTPYAIRSKVNLPKGYPITRSTARHELGHTVRHTLVSIRPSTAKCMQLHYFCTILLNKWWLLLSKMMNSTFNCIYSNKSS